MITRNLRYVLRSAIGAGLLAAATAMTPAAAETKAAILLPGSINDQSWNALGFAILQSLKPHGFTTAYSENVADADEAEALRGYASQGYSIVMGHSGRFVSAMEQVAPDFPKTQFIAVSGNEGSAPNVMSIDYETRKVALKMADGSMVRATVSPKLPDFDKVHVGDQVVFDYTEALTINVNGN